MGIIRNNFSHTGYNARREGSHQGKWVNHDETESKSDSNATFVSRCVLKWVNHQRREDRENPNHGTDQRQMVGQCLLAPSMAFLEIEDSKVRSERIASHTHLAHLMSSQLRRSFCGEDSLEEKEDFGCDAIWSLHGAGGFINEVLVALAQR